MEKEFKFRNRKRKTKETLLNYVSKQEKSDYINYMPYDMLSDLLSKYDMESDIYNIKVDVYNRFGRELDEKQKSDSVDLQLRDIMYKLNISEITDIFLKEKSLNYLTEQEKSDYINYMSDDIFNDLLSKYDYEGYLFRKYGESDITNINRHFDERLCRGFYETQKFIYVDLKLNTIKYKLKKKELKLKNRIENKLKNPSGDKKE